MARIARKFILAETNHVMLRGIGHLELFLHDEDYHVFQRTLSRVKTEEGVVILAYCLMDNHVHLLLQGRPEVIPHFLQRVEVRYALYYNRVYEHVGHLFQNRYRSQAVRDDRYFLNALRYILHNPEQAGLCRWETYPWSSAQSYLTGANDGVTETSRACILLGGRATLCSFLGSAGDGAECMIDEPGFPKRGYSDADAVKITRRACGLKHPNQIGELDRDARMQALAKLKKEGLTIRQLERITGLNRNMIQRA